MIGILHTFISVLLVAYMLVRMHQGEHVSYPFAFVVGANTALLIMLTIQRAKNIIARGKQ